MLYAKKCSPQGSILKHDAEEEQSRARVAEAGLPQKMLMKGFWKLSSSVRVDRVFQAKQLSNTLGRSPHTLSVQALTPLCECALKWAR